MKIVLYTVLAILPSIIWLLFYLRKDKHPEPNKIIIKIFSLGILATFGALVLQWLFKELVSAIFTIQLSFLFLGGMAFIEEYLKYFIVKKYVLKSSEFDEPTDAMLYLIIAALGFAAAENIFLLNGLYMLGTPLNQVLIIVLGRFLGAVFLHALASGIVGYFLARSLLLKTKRKIFMVVGIVLASCLHTFYNYIIIRIGPYNNLSTTIILLAVLLGTMAIVVSLGFKKLKKLKSICKI